MLYEKLRFKDYGQYYHYITFDSLTDQIESCKAVKYKWNIPHRPKGGMNPSWFYGDHGSEFIGRAELKSMEDAFAAVSTPWDEGLEVYERVKRQLEDVHIEPPKSLKRKGAWSEDDGSEVDIDRLQKGQAYWRSTERHHRPGPVTATIVTNVWHPAYVRYSDVIWRGAASIYLAELLEQSGYRVELWTTCVTTDMCLDGINGAISTCVKRPHEPLDTVTMLNLISGWGLRTLWFNSFWTVPNQNATAHYGLQDDVDMEGVARSLSRDENVFISSDTNQSFHGAISWIKQQLEKIK